MFSENDVRRAIREELRNIIIRHNLRQLNEKRVEDKNGNILANASLNLPDQKDPLKPCKQGG